MNITLGLNGSYIARDGGVANDLGQSFTATFRGGMKIDTTTIPGKPLVSFDLDLDIDGVTHRATYTSARSNLAWFIYSNCWYGMTLSFAVRMMRSSHYNWYNPVINGHTIQNNHESNN